MKFSDDLLARACFLLYREWAQRHDALKAVKAERDDGSPDWELFHADRLARATKELEGAKRLLDEIKPHDPLTKAARSLDV